LIVGKATAGDLAILVVRQLEVEVRRNLLLHRWERLDELIAEQGLEYQPAVWLRCRLTGGERMAWVRAWAEAVRQG
jgi:hypothetical protein